MHADSRIHQLIYRPIDPILSPFSTTGKISKNKNKVQAIEWNHLSMLDSSIFKYRLCLTSGTDWTGCKPDGPAMAESVGSDDIGLVIPLLVAINPLDVDVHVDVVVAL